MSAVVLAGAAALFGFAWYSNRAQARPAAMSLAATSECAAFCRHYTECGFRCEVERDCSVQPGECPASKRAWLAFTADDTKTQWTCAKNGTLYSAPRKALYGPDYHREICEQAGEPLAK